MARSTCRNCKEVFTSISSFDMHRVGGYGEPIYQESSTGRSQKVVGHTPSTRRCLTEQEMLDKGMVRTARGPWATAEFDASVFRSEDEAPANQ